MIKIISRSWFLSTVTEASELDFKISEILNYFYLFCSEFTNSDSFSNINDLDNYLKNNDSLYPGFNDWFFFEGKETVMKLSNLSFDRCDLFLCEELDYFCFILNVNLECITDYPEDSFLTLIDVFYCLDSLLEISNS